MVSCQLSRQDLLLNTNHTHYLGGRVLLWRVELVNSRARGSWIRSLEVIAHSMET